ncbi:WhiB family transcriptional regulator [Rhodococcus sp. 14C212]|uniref:WhiB family transcriptional regulator n=1 Tax=Rhodococcus sp. 14C212 TaxID=2711209 RepID=UPI003211F4BB
MLAACRDADSNLFFDFSPGGPEEQEAKRICGTCPVLEPCRLHAIDDPELHGIWGGLSPEERHIYRRRRKWFNLPVAR